MHPEIWTGKGRDLWDLGNLAFWQEFRPRSGCSHTSLDTLFVAQNADQYETK